MQQRCEGDLSLLSHAPQAGLSEMAPAVGHYVKRATAHNRVPAAAVSFAHIHYTSDVARNVRACSCCAVGRTR
jgi:hypothetical protein